MSQIGILEEINISRISHPSKQLRTHLEGIEELADSIRQYGLLQPIVVRPLQSYYEVVAGNRRLAAVKLLKMRKICCHIVELRDKEAYEVALVENVQHKTMSAIEEANAFNRYVEEYGWGGVTELAKRIGRSQEYVSKRIQLLRLPERVRDEIIRQRITPSVALEMLPLDKDSIEEFADFIVKNPLTKDEVRRIVKTSTKCYPDDSLHGQLVIPGGKDQSDTLAYEKELYLLDKTLRKSIAVMKSTLVNFDDILDNVKDEWVLKELLMQYRMIIHGDIDTFLKLRRRLETKIPRGYFAQAKSEKMVPVGANRQTNQAPDGGDSSIHLWATKGIWQ